MTTERIDFTCPKCGQTFTSVILPVRHNCRARGAGDAVAKVTAAMGLKPCGGCKQRQKLLNRIWPFKS